ncbi:MAG TPA: hypothetical protein VLF91_03710 [Candidatus Saccharimonadales bacterium]|nr:hypothetical protein [Candidatus Saccharimonadales bacterium]
MANPFLVRSRAKAFDAIIEASQDALTYPLLASRLGPLATKLTDINSRCFLPNVRSGRAVLPDGYGDTHGNIPLLPVTDSEASRLSEVIQPLAAWLGPLTLLPRKRYSFAHDRDVDSDELYGMIFGRPSPAVETGAQTVYGMQIHEPGRTTTAFELHRGGYRLGIPIISYRLSYEGTKDHSLLPLVSLHEYQHAHTRLALGPLALTREGRAADELRAFAITREVHQNYCPHARVEGAPLVALELQQRYGDPARPFYMPPALTDALEETGII